MLFNQIYNWLKFKTLTPSLVFKNRLFIERDLRVRRISNNMGWIFRSSKWLQYLKPNLFTLNFYRYLRYSISAVLLIILFYLVLSPVNFIFIINFLHLILSYIWLTFETLSYYFTYLIWVCSNVILLCIQRWTPLNRVNLGSTDNLLYTSSTYLSTLQQSKPLNLNNYLISCWLFNNNTKRVKLLLNESFEFEKYNLFFFNLYKTQKYLHLPNSITFSSLIFNFNFSNLSAIIPNFFVHNLYVVYNKSNLTPTHTAKYSLNNLLMHKSNLYFINTFSTKYSNLDIKNNQLHEHLYYNNLNYVLNMKTFRWFYKYSTLHRQSFKIINQLSTSNLLSTNTPLVSKLTKTLWLNQYISTLNTDLNLNLNVNLAKNNNLLSTNLDYLFMFNRTFNLQTINNLKLSYSIKPLSPNLMSHKSPSTDYLKPVSTVWYNNSPFSPLIYKNTSWNLKNLIKLKSIFANKPLMHITMTLNAIPTELNYTVFNLNTSPNHNVKLVNWDLNTKYPCLNMVSYKI